MDDPHLEVAGNFGIKCKDKALHGGCCSLPWLLQTHWDVRRCLLPPNGIFLQQANISRRRSCCVRCCMSSAWHVCCSIKMHRTSRQGHFSHADSTQQCSSLPATKEVRLPQCRCT